MWGLRTITGDALTMKITNQQGYQLISVTKARRATKLVAEAPYVSVYNTPSSEQGAALALCIDITDSGTGARFMLTLPPDKLDSLITRLVEAQTQVAKRTEIAQGYADQLDALRKRMGVK